MFSNQEDFERLATIYLKELFTIKGGFTHFYLKGSFPTLNDSASSLLDNKETNEDIHSVLKCMGGYKALGCDVLSNSMGEEWVLPFVR